MVRWHIRENMRVLVLCSAGKDSSLAAWWALCKGWDVAGLVTVAVEGEDSMMFQLQGTMLAALQASAMGIGWMPVVVQGEEELEVAELERALEGVVAGESGPPPDEVEWPDGWHRPSNLHRIEEGGRIDAIISGAIRSEYQRRRLERMAQRLGVISYSPLWHHDPLTHMRELVECGFGITLSSVSCDGLDKTWVGRTIDIDSLVELNEIALSHRFSVDGEGGEYETVITGGPHMSQTIKLQSEVKWFGSRGELQITGARLD